ncbi:MAG: DUF3368 domain-containing protein [Salinisphaeraceae bacterium]|nr:DUF3368 domain-containing protein [Salinisphaeraceae bacterium]
MSEGDLLAALFAGPWRIVTPNALFYRELENSHAEFIDFGLELLEVHGEWVLRSTQWHGAYPKTSAMDRLCLALALQENCPLITGDAQLKTAAEAEGCTVHGTIWLIENLVETEIVSRAQALAGYDAMENAGRRLPFGRARRRLREE